jgi:hypothetical protein
MRGNACGERTGGAREAATGRTQLQYLLARTRQGEVLGRASAVLNKRWALWSGGSGPHGETIAGRPRLKVVVLRLWLSPAPKLVEAHAGTRGLGFQAMPQLECCASS